MASGPLDGIRILEFTQIIAGPLGCMFLSDMGAEVIKVEPIEGEPWRLNRQFVPLESKTYQALNRGKQSLSIDLTKTQSQEAIHRLVEHVDVVVINYRPDVAGQLNIDYETLRKLSPNLVYVDSTAFGRRGPLAQRPGYDIVIQAATGIAAGGARFDDRGNPLLPGGAVVDSTTGYAIAWAVCAALFHRERTGRGQLVETSLFANGLMMQHGEFMSLPAADGDARDAFIERLREAREQARPYREFVEEGRELLRRGWAGNVYYRCYNTKNGAIAIGCLSQSLREKMRQALDIEDIRDEPGYDMTAPESMAFAERLTAQVEAIIAAERTEHWVELFEATGVPVSPLEFVQDLLDKPQVAENGYAAELEHDLTGPQWQVAPPIKMSDSPPQPQGASPPLGRDNDRVLALAGYSTEEIESMRAAGVIR